MRSTTTIRRRRPSAGVVLSLVALFVALGGTSYAAVSLPKNSVGTPQIKQSAVTAAKLKAGAVTGAKVKDGSLRAADFKAGELPAGPQGPKGDQGAQGASGMSGYEIVTAADLVVGDTESKQQYAYCPAGKMAVGGGYDAASSLGIQLNRSGPTDRGDGWFVRLTNASGSSKTIRAQAICVTVAP